MSRVEVRPFAAEDVADAGRLLAARHVRHRATESLLDSRFDEPGEAEAAVAALWQVAGASGAVAVVDGEACGFLIWDAEAGRGVGTQRLGGGSRTRGALSANLG